MLTSVDAIVRQWLWAMGIVYLVVLIVFIVAAAAALNMIFKSYMKWRGTRLISCPETGECESVQVDAKRAALSLAGHQTLRLKECSRWPERRNCGQECLRQIELAPEACLLRSIIAEWYAERECVYCARKLDNINWMEHKPALLAPDGTSREWTEFKPETIPSLLTTHQAVCWNCHIAESFRAEHPDLVVERRWKHQAR